MTLSNIQIGSVVYNMFTNIPVGISGLLLNGVLVDNNIFFAEQFTGANISNTAVPDAYQPGIISLTAANVLSLMEADNTETQNIKIGELGISKGITNTSSQNLRQDGIEKLKAIGERVSFYQTFT